MSGRWTASLSRAAVAALTAAWAGAFPDQSPGGGVFGLGIFFSLGTGTVLLLTYSTEGEALGLDLSAPGLPGRDVVASDWIS